MPQIFGLFLKNKFVAKFFQREPNLVTLQVQSIMLYGCTQTCRNMVPTFIDLSFGLLLVGPFIASSSHLVSRSKWNSEIDQNKIDI